MSILISVLITFVVVILVLYLVNMLRSTVARGRSCGYRHHHRYPVAAEIPVRLLDERFHELIMESRAPANRHFAAKSRSFGLGRHMIRTMEAPD